MPSAVLVEIRAQRVARTNRRLSTAAWLLVMYWCPSSMIDSLINEYDGEEKDALHTKEIESESQSYFRARHYRKTSCPFFIRWLERRGRGGERERERERRKTTRDDDNIMSAGFFRFSSRLIIKLMSNLHNDFCQVFLSKSTLGPLLFC